MLINNPKNIYFKLRDILETEWTKEGKKGRKQLSTSTFVHIALASSLVRKNIYLEDSLKQKQHQQQSPRSNLSGRSQDRCIRLFIACAPSISLALLQTQRNVVMWLDARWAVGDIPSPPNQCIVKTVICDQRPSAGNTAEQLMQYVKLVRQSLDKNLYFFSSRETFSAANYLSAFDFKWSRVIVIGNKFQTSFNWFLSLSFLSSFLLVINKFDEICCAWFSRLKRGREIVN